METEQAGKSNEMDITIKTTTKRKTTMTTKTTVKTATAIVTSTWTASATTTTLIIMPMSTTN